MFLFLSIVVLTILLIPFSFYIAWVSGRLKYNGKKISLTELKIDILIGIAIVLMVFGIVFFG